MALLDFLIPAAANIASGIFSSRGAERAGETAADASQYAADLQFQSAKDLLDFQKNIFGYQTAQDAYNRQQAERALGLNIGQYGDQYGLTQRTFDIMGNQLGYGNALRQNAMSNLQQFANLGLGSLGGLAAMTGGTGAGITGPSPYNVQAPGPIAPLGPSQVQYTPQDTEALFRSILDNPSFQLPGGGDEEDEDTTEGDRQLAGSLADWYIRTLGGNVEYPVGETGGEGLGPSGNTSGRLADLPSTPGYQDAITRDLGLVPEMPVSPTMARAVGFMVSTPIGMLLSNMTDEEIALKWGELMAAIGPTSSGFGIEGTTPGTDLGFSGYSFGQDTGFATGGTGGGIGSGLGGFADSPAGQAGGYGGSATTDAMGGDLGYL